MTQSSAALRREAIIAAARSWLGTPFVPGAAARGVGCDCLGLVTGVLAQVGAAPNLPARDPDPALAGPVLLAWAQQVLPPSSFTNPADLLVFADRPGGSARHAGIATGPDAFIHAHWRCGVIERPLIAWWRTRLVAAFTLTELPWRP